MARAQSPLLVTVRTSGGTALGDATVIATSAGTSVRTDGLGIARFRDLSRPSKLVIAKVGFIPDTVIAGAGDSSIVVTLVERTPTLADLTVFAGEDMLTPSLTGQWVLPRQLLQQMPIAVEPDPLRALSLVPAVSFSSPLSARPLLRGYDADESVVRLDGYEITSPYHLARAFSGIASEALDRVVVSPASHELDVSGTLAGVINMVGREAATSSHGGVALSPVSLIGWLGGRRVAPTFAALRFGFLEKFSNLLGESVPYNFHDGYLRTALRLPAAMTLAVTGYTSSDGVGAARSGQGMNWSNNLLGLRLRVSETTRHTIELGASTNRFSLSGVSLPIRGSVVDLANRISRTTLNGTMALGASRTFTVGGGVTFRRARTAVVQQSGDEVFPQDADSRLTEVQAFAQEVADLGRLTITGGLRIDASQSAHAIQPRIRVAAALGRSLTGSVSYSRTSRLFYLLSDPQPEPQLLFAQFWVTAGERGVPVPAVDHVSASLDWAPTGWAISGSAYASRGRHIGELRPETDAAPSASAFRFGDSRTAGIELRATRRITEGSPPLLALTYVLSWSDRRFDSGTWRPWKLNRTHLLRVQLSKAAGERWFVFAAAELQSGQPMTRVLQVVRTDPPPVDAADPPGTGRLAYRYEDENASRSAGTVHFDIGAQLRIAGPGSSHITLGASVINAGFGPVAPQSPVPASELGIFGGGTVGVPYRRAYSLPAVPTITARIEF